MNKTQLTETTAQAIREHVNAEATEKRLLSELDKVSGNRDSRANTACEMAFKAMMAGITGDAIATASGVSGMAVSRYIAGGQVMLQTDGKVTGSKVISDIGNGYLTVGQAKQIENVSQYNKAVAEGKKAKAGKTGKAEGRSPLEIAEAHIEAIGKAVKAGKVSLEEITNLWVAMVSSLDIEAEAPVMEDAKI
jgi:hypothetical protein